MPVDKKQIAIVASIVVVAVVDVVVVWAFNSAQKREEVTTTAEGSAEALNEAVEKVVAPVIAVPTSANPVKQVLPKETPLEKTNPFNKTYVNPFE